MTLLENVQFKLLNYHKGIDKQPRRVNMRIFLDGRSS